MGRGGILFLPQRAYMVIGSLRDQLTYPEVHTEQGETRDNKLKLILQMLDLGHVLERVEGNWSTVLTWEDILSVGEQQRIAMARLFYHQPLFAILDECTSALNVELERKFYVQCQQLGIHYISVGHRSTLLEYHDEVLMMDKTAWTLTPIQRIREIIENLCLFFDNNGSFESLW